MQVSKPFLAALVFVTSAALALAEATKLAYAKENAVWVALSDGSRSEKIAAGDGPELSPNGKLLAFYTQQRVGQPAHRQIAVADLAPLQRGLERLTFGALAVDRGVDEPGSDGVHPHADRGQVAGDRRVIPTTPPLEAE